MRKKILFFAMTLLLLTGITASADVLGEQNGGWSTYMGAFTYFHNVQFNSDSVGKQNEYYVEYTPNEDAVPIVVNGASIWGTRNIKQAEQYIQKNGLRPLVGINADYFSFKTGIPMGYTIADGEIISKEYGGQDAVGFRSDGSGFIKWLDIQTTVTDGEKTIDVMYINKWCQAGFDPVYLLTDKFGETTKTQSECIFVICTPNEGRLHVDETMSLTVDDVFIYNGEIEIPEGKVVLLMDTSGVSEYYDFLSRLHAGQTLTVANQAVGDDGTWKTAENAVSSVGGRLVTNGVANSDFEAGAAPRTAVGIKADGNIIFYTLDGRQSGYSYGAQLKTLAKRMVELGCVDALNLDGGGSTTISAWFPGKDNTMVVNSPSDGYLRSVANYIFLKDNRERTNIPWIINITGGTNNNYLSGMTANINIESVYDTANYKMEEPYNIKYRADTDTDSTVDENGAVKGVAAGTCTISVSAKNDPSVSADVDIAVRHLEEKDGCTYVDGILIVNKTYSLPESYDPAGLTAETQTALDKMIEDAYAAGLNLYDASDYRSYPDQLAVYQEYCVRDGWEEADTYSARPGHSEHQTGMVIDFNDINSDFDDTAEAQWLAENCANYGFIVRFPEGKEPITGYKYESWHVRYVGVETAKEIMSRGICLEEYLGVDSEYKNTWPEDPCNPESGVSEQ